MTANVSIVVAQRDDALTVPNSALRFHPPNTGMMATNAAVPQVAQVTTNGNPSGADGWQGHHGGGRARGERPVIHTVYLLSGEGKDAKLRPVQIRTGISDGISTEVLSGLNEGDHVVTGTALPSGSAAAPSNPFGGGGGFPRR
jgi:HlyD family secretion protein